MLNKQKLRIFAYINSQVPKTRKEILEYLIHGLQRLEYRGYDSAGLAVYDATYDNKTIAERQEVTKYPLKIVREPGKVKNLENEIKKIYTDESLKVIFDTHVGIAHTRWATHGVPSLINSHPQRSDSDGEFLVVHNGIITNNKEVRKFLMLHGYNFESETDTECFVKLIKHIHSKHTDRSLRRIVDQAVMQLEGAFAFCVISKHYPGEIVAAKRSSPLLIGIKSKHGYTKDHIPVMYHKTLDQSSLTNCDNEDTIFGPSPDTCEIEYFFASDASALIEHTNQVIYLEDDDIAVVKNGCLSIHRLKISPDDPVNREIVTLKLELQQIMKGNFTSFMLKEIFEQPESVLNTMRGRVKLNKHDPSASNVVLGGIKEFMADILRCRRLLFIACGTSYHSALATRQLLEETSELPVMIELASDFLDRHVPVFRDDVACFISQSGETADTLLALRYCKSRGAITIGITNTVGSSICRETHCGIHVNAGPEIGVASTKAYTSQIISLIMFSLVLCEDKISMQPRRLEIIDELCGLPDKIREVLKLDTVVQTLAKDLFHQRSLLLLGRGVNFATCLEGALKIKELAYMHSEGILAGELKHGPLAMVDENIPLIVVATKDAVYTKCINAIHQLTCRGGLPILVIEKGDKELKELSSKFIEVPHTVDCLQSILTIIPLQLLAYHIAVLRECNVNFYPTYVQCFASISRLIVQEISQSL